MIQNLRKNLIPLSILVAGLFIAGAFVYVNQGGRAVLSPEQAAEKAIDFINQTIEENVTASLIDVVEDGEIYKIHLKIEDTEYESYITKDGKYLFPTAGFNLEEQAEEISGEEQVEEELDEEIAPSDDFAKCLTEKGMKFYGSKYCGWCAKQKELFGDSLQYLAYVECVDPETDQWSEECQAAGIQAVPTWQLADGEMSPGFKPLEQLAELSGCPLK